MVFETQKTNTGIIRKNSGTWMHGNNKRRKTKVSQKYGESQKGELFKTMSKLVIGIDESYTRTGITVLIDKELYSMQSIYFTGCKCNTDKRKAIRKTLYEILDDIRMNCNADEIKCIIERIRTFSGGHMSAQYLITTGGLITTIIDVMHQYNVPVYSVDTKSWKNNIIGDSKPLNNPYGINPNKYPTILYLKQNGLLKYIAEPYKGRGEKGVIKVKIDGKRVPCKINDDLADSYCIAMYGFLPKTKQKLKEEKF